MQMEQRIEKRTGAGTDRRTRPDAGPLKLALIGAGQRGMIYAKYALDSGRAVITAVAEPHEQRRLRAGAVLGVDPGHLYADTEAFFAAGRLADAVIIASMDRDHYGQCLRALDLGCDILLEKPISPDPRETLAIQRRAHETGRQVIVCHVLRYTAFFAEIKKIIDSGELGKVVSIQHNENVGNFHIAHAFVRGNWRRQDLSSPIIMQKSCHDMDILTWLAGADASRISSFGSLTYFREENAPPDSTDRCLGCPAAARCRFDARKAYLPVRGSWPAAMLSEDQSEAGILNALETGPYGRCVYRCDNDVCDNQVVLIEFKNDVTVSFNMSGFTNKMNRTIKVMCEDGEIRGDDSLNILEITRFTSSSADRVEKRVIQPAAAAGFHGGGDSSLMDDFLAQLDGTAETSRSTIDLSVESHLMASAAEHARVNGTVVNLDEYRRRLEQ